MSTCSVGRISTPKAISEEGVKPSRVYDTQTKVRDYDSDSTQDLQAVSINYKEKKKVCKKKTLRHWWLATQRWEKFFLYKSEVKTDDKTATKIKKRNAQKWGSKKSKKKSLADTTRLVEEKPV